MANTTFSGPVRSENGFKDITKGANGTTTENVSISHDGVNSIVIFSDLPTADPTVAGQLWNNLGVLNVSAG